MYEYSFRKWPLYTGYRKIEAEFGTDVVFYQQNLLFNPALMFAVLVSSFYGPVFYGFSDYGRGLRAMNMEAFFMSQGSSWLRSVLWTIALVAFVMNAIFVQREREALMHRHLTMPAFILAKLKSDTTQLDLKKSLCLREAAEIVRVVPKTFVIEQKINILENEMYDKLSEHLLSEDLGVSCFGAFMQMFGKKRDKKYYLSKIRRLEAKLHKLNASNNNCAFIVLFSEEEIFRRNLGAVKAKGVKINGKKPKVISDIEERNMLLANLDYNNFDRSIRLFCTILISLAVSIVLCIFLVYYRNICRRWRDSSPNWFIEQVIYYSSYLIVILFDQALRPILRWSATFEKFGLLSSQERGFYFKYFFYELVNRFTIFVSRSWENGRPNLTRIIQMNTNWRKDSESIGMDLVNIFLIELFGYNAMDLIFSLLCKWIFSCNRATEYGRERYYNGEPIRYASLYTNFSVMEALLMGFSPFEPLIIPIFAGYCLLESFITRLRLFRLTAPPPVTDSLSREYSFNEYFNCALAVFLEFLSYGKPALKSIMLVVVEGIAFLCVSLTLVVVITKMSKPMTERSSDEPFLDEELVEEELSLADRFNIVKAKYNKEEQTQLELEIK